MKSTSLAAAVASRTGKSLKIVLFLKEEKIGYKMFHFVFKLS